MNINAEVTDVHGYIFDQNRKHADNAPDNISDLGGDGFDFAGGIQAFRCPKGTHCGWALNGWSGKGRSFIAQRELYAGTVNAGLFYLPLISGPFTLDGSMQRAGLQDELKAAIHTAIIGGDSVKSLSDETISASWETGYTMCARLGRSTGTICGASSGTRTNTDVIRLHFDAHITPNPQSWCTTTADILDALTFGLSFGAFDNVCDQISGSYRATADVWLWPTPGNPGQFYQLQVAEVGHYYSVRAYSGAGASTVLSTLQDKFEKSDAATMLRNGFIMKVGQALCVNHDANWASRCTTDGVHENDLSAGVNFFQAAPPVRVLLGLNVGTGNSLAVNYFQPVNNRTADGHAGLLDLELSQ